MVYYLLAKDRLGKFIDSLAGEYEVIAPVKSRGVHVFRKISSFSEARLDDYVNTLYPAKNVFLPDTETLIRFNSGVSEEFDKTRKVIFGIRPCDVNAQLIVDRLYMDELKDDYYARRRGNTLLLALNCVKSGENCFCDSVGADALASGFDLLFTDIPKKNAYHIEVGSEAGGKIMRDYNGGGLTETDFKPKISLNANKKLSVDKVGQLSSEFNNPVWGREAEKCLSCAACTQSCPTCCCFDMLDEFDLDLDSGVRERVWASCQVRDFTRVAGGFVFRDERFRRLRHRIYHKLNYFKEQFNVQMCTGCGRCITNCPTGIDMVEIVNSL